MTRHRVQSATAPAAPTKVTVERPWTGTREPAVRATQVYRFFHAGEEEVLALRGVDLLVDAGEVVALVGPSGSGKSTLMAAIAGLDDPDGGLVAVAGHRMSHRPDAERSRLRRDRIGMLYQSDNLLAHLTVEQNLRLARRLTRRHRTPLDPPVDTPGRSGAGDDRDGGPAWARVRLAEVGLATRGGALPTQLSGGEAARAGLAVALAGDPQVLLADEPTAELDTTSEAQLLGLLQVHAAGGMAVVVATHSPRVIAVADRVVHLQDGQVVTARSAGAEPVRPTISSRAMTR